MRVFEQHESNVRSYSRAFPAVFARAEGACLFDERGRRYIDFLSGAGALNYGHNNPRLKRALLRYLAEDGITSSLDMATVAKRQFIERFDAAILGPRGLSYRQQFTGPTGADAVEAALKLARKATGRGNVIAFTGAYHGLSSGALSVTADRQFRHETFVNRHNVTFCPYDRYAPAVDSLAYLTQVLADRCSGVDLPAAILLETVQAEGGINVASREWLLGIEALCRAHGIVLIADDIQVGNGRTGTYFSFERAGIRPDIVVLSKSIGGYGLPMSLLLVHPDLDVWKPGEHCGTFRGNNLAFIAGAEALGYWDDPALARHIEQLAVRAGTGLRGIEARYPDHIGEVRGVGLIWGLAIADGPLASKIRNEAFARGLIVELCGGQDRVIKILPPLLMEESLFAEGLSILEEAIAAVLPFNVAVARGVA